MAFIPLARATLLKGPAALFWSCDTALFSRYCFGLAVLFAVLFWPCGTVLVLRYCFGYYDIVVSAATHFRQGATLFRYLHFLPG